MLGYCWHVSVLQSRKVERIQIIPADQLRSKHGDTPIMLALCLRPIQQPYCMRLICKAMHHTQSKLAVQQLYKVTLEGRWIPLELTRVVPLELAKGGMVT